MTDPSPLRVVVIGGGTGLSSVLSGLTHYARLSRLFQYRFATVRGLKGHSFGNLFLMALTQVMGDFANAVTVSSEVLNIAGRIYPSTSENVSLEAKLADGT